VERGGGDRKRRGHKERKGLKKGMRLERDEGEKGKSRQD